MRSSAVIAARSGVAGVPIRRGFPGWARSDDCGGHTLQAIPSSWVSSSPNSRFTSSFPPLSEGSLTLNPWPSVLTALRSFLCCRVRLPRPPDSFPPARGVPQSAATPSCWPPRDQPAGVRLDALRLRAWSLGRGARRLVVVAPTVGLFMLVITRARRACRHRPRGGRALLRARCEMPDRDVSGVLAVDGRSLGEFCRSTGRRGCVNGGTGAVAGVVVMPAGAPGGGHVGADDGSGFRPVSVLSSDAVIASPVRPIGTDRRSWAYGTGR